MAATYRRVVTTANCYSSVVIDRRLQQAVHYCTGACQVFKQGVMCIVAHHSVCAELVKVPTSDRKCSDLTRRFSMPENSLSLTGDEDYHQILPNNPRLKKGSSVQSTGSLKNITGEAINLASGKIKEFSFEKLRSSSNHVTYRKGRKVKSDPFNRRSLDFDLIYGHFSNDENSPPPFGLSQVSLPEEKWQVTRTSVEGNVNSTFPMPLQTFSEESFITQILEKHKLDGSSSGDIKMCLDILLKCSEDLKKCTDIIKQCIKKKSSGSGSGGNSNDPLVNSEIIYMNLMTRFSSYLKKLPFEFRQPGLTEPSDMIELMNSLSALQQAHFPPIFGNEQPPKYEDVVRSPSTLTRQSLAMDLQGSRNTTDTIGLSKPTQILNTDFFSTDLHDNNQQDNLRYKNDGCSLPQLGSVSLPSCISSMETLYIVEESDREKELVGISNVKSRESWENSKSSQHRAEKEVHAMDTTKKLPVVGQSVTLAQTLTQATNINSLDATAQISKEESKKNNQEEIDKLLLDLEHFSQKMETTLRETSKTNGHKMEEEDKTLLLRILESIEDFAQELVEFRMGKGSLSKEKEVMYILQETLATPSVAAFQQSHPSAAAREPTAALIQQTPEFIKVQNKQEKKPVTPSPAPINSAISSPSPLPANKVIVGAPLSINIPRFYFPNGLPNVCSNHEETIAKIEAAFSEFEEERATINEMGNIAKICCCPLYWKAPMFIASGGERTGFVSVHSFVAMWRKIVQNCHDDASKFICLLSKPNCNFLVQEDFIPLLQDVVETHPGLTFLKDAPEFHSRYITTVIQRIFYTVNRSWSGQISLTELRKSNFLQTLALLEEEEDINQITDYFSYEHFYVIYCKFWELDTDHDLYISQKDLARYNDQALSSRIIEKIFTGAVLRGNQVHKENQMSYADFVWLLISEEDKRSPTSIEYWFRCMDLDGDGMLSMYELEYFYEEQCERMESMGIEPLPFHDLLCQMLDLVKPECDGRVTLRDLKRCRMAHVFYNTFFNLEKYLDNEQRDPFAVQKDVENDGPEPSDWDRYAAEEYEILVAEESGNEHLQEGSFDDDYEADELLALPEIGEKSDKLVISDLPT
ncbi:serine/threonine-protein phosphatase 2A regulatory subunit B'' subunit alpha isoform X2 [Paroedura picta]|uniref:serine/threonine-protein phosphatase 2A regulatory subunit B'' subunit alpha isoform X2 n=1 Tax=Paroedura picta TaxID=143630 RepID=UPI00405629D6